jgi:hypothetical protein
MTLPLWQWLEQEGAHHDVCAWARPYDADWSKAWTECPRGDWLLGLAVRRGVERAAIVRAACACAELGLDYVPDDESGPRRAIELARRWAAGEDDAGTRAELAAELEATVDAAPDPAVAAAGLAALAALRSIEAPDEAATVAASVAQAAVLDAGECAMMSALGYAQRTCADRVREHVSLAALGVET